MGPWKRECKALRRPYKGVLPWGSVPSNVAMFFQLATFQRLAGSLSGDLDPHSAFRRVERLGPMPIAIRAVRSLGRWIVNHEIYHI